VERIRRPFAGQALPVPEEQLLRLEAGKRLRRPESEQRMNAEPFASGPEVRSRADRLRADEDALARKPEGDLVPARDVQNARDLEGRARDPGEGRDVERDTEPRCDSRAVPVVAIEQLDDAGRLAEASDALVDAGPVDRIENPDLPARRDRMRRAAAQLRLRRRPADAAFELVDVANVDQRNRSRSGGMTRSCAPPSPATSRPRTIAAGTRAVFPITSSAAPATSSASAIRVACSS
jgi:hypothetical protein